ncbi:MAG: DNA repair protein RecN [Defluviitaleaceae bacterium]|nr:DNA repair protein RecN [Defluviitaleaceae bacterium]
MLELLTVSNVALIEEARVEFGAGLNVLSGETGAGKSILIDALGFVLGGKAGKEFIRSGANDASVEALFRISQPAVANSATAGCEEILVSRSIDLQGKSVCRLNGKTVTATMVRELAAQLLDVHGQHEHQSLLDSAKHLHLLDRFCQDDLAAPRTDLSKLIEQYKELQKKAQDLAGNDNENEEQLEFYRFQMQEIQASKLSVSEEEELIERKQLLVNSEKVHRLAHEFVELDISGVISRAAECARMLAELDKSHAQNSEALGTLHPQIADLAANFTRYTEQLDHDPESLDKIENRLDALYRLKQKYKRDIPEILNYYNELQNKFMRIEQKREKMDILAGEKRTLEKEIGRACLAMSKVRKDAASRLSTQIVGILQDLGMEDAQFSIELTRRKEFGANGFDRAEFLICANLGGTLAPLSRIASGGEMSRVMLALKTALADFDAIPTFIFDEIDTGISGRTANQVASKLALIAKSHQILCVTHLPQIAAMGDQNFLIEKTTESSRTLTHIHHLTETGVITEIARLIGGAQITNTTRDAAKEMRSQAVSIKSLRG